MSFAVWKSKPPFNDAGPGEVIYQVGSYWVVTDQGQPTQQTVDDFLTNQATQAVADAKDINKLSKLQIAEAIYFGQLLGKTPAQLKAGVQAVYDSLP